MLAEQIKEEDVNGRLENTNLKITALEVASLNNMEQNGKQTPSILRALLDKSDLRCEPAGNETVQIMHRELKTERKSFDEESGDGILELGLVKLETEMEIDGDMNRQFNILESDPLSCNDSTEVDPIVDNDQAIETNVSGNKFTVPMHKEYNKSINSEFQFASVFLPEYYEGNICKLKCRSTDEMKHHTCIYDKPIESNSSNNLLNHTVTKWYKCNVCEYKCISARGLRNHQWRHTGIKPHKCDVCDTRFSVLDAMKRHMRNAHSSERPYKCNSCDYKSADRNRLKTHMKKHTDNKPYECNICDYKSRESSNLKTHMMYKHTGEKPLKCDICEYRCCSKAVLIVHMRAHTGEKPFKCNICHNEFAYISSLKIHLSVHTGVKLHKCHYCDYQNNKASKLNQHIQDKHT